MDAPPDCSELLGDEDEASGCVEDVSDDSYLVCVCVLCVCVCACVCVCVCVFLASYAFGFA